MESTHRLLIVDDDKALCRLLTEYLEPEGFCVSAAHTGPDGLQAVQAGEFDAMVLANMTESMAENMMDTYIYSYIYMYTHKNKYIYIYIHISI